MSPEDWVLLDRDGVINYDSSSYVRSPSEWQAAPGALDAIARLTRAGREIAVVSNQSGIGRGLFTPRDLAAINERMVAEVEANGGRLAAIYWCPHLPDAGCDCRKPRTGLLRQVAERFGVSLAGSPLIGDKDSDCQAAVAFGARPILVRAYRDGVLEPELEGSTYETYRDLAEAVDVLLRERN